MADKLFPCPFCGREAEQDLQQAYRAMQDGRVDHGAAVYCTGCNANMIMCRGDHPELSDEERMAVVVEDWNRRTPPPSTHLRAIADAAQAYVESVNGEPEKDCWDTQDGKEAEGAQRFASDFAWQAYDQRKQKAFDDLSAALGHGATE